MTSHSPSGTRVAGGLFAPTEEQKNLLAAWTADALDDDGRSAMPYFAHILLALRVLDAPGLGTFAVDPYFRLYVDFEAVQAKGHRWCVESLLHEASHVWLDHFEVYDEVAWLGPVDRMTVNVACFPAGTLLPGGVPIESVATMERHYEGDLVRVESTGGSVEATTEHPFFVRRRRHKKGCYPIVLDEPEWLNAEDLREGDYLCVPRLSEKRADTRIDLSGYTQQTLDRNGRVHHNNRAVRSLPLNEDIAWLIGLYVAEGDSSPNVRFSLSASERHLAARVAEIAAAVGYSASACEAPERNSLVVSLGTTVFGRWLKEHCGGHAHDKHIPDVILRHHDAAIRAAFLRGLRDGDGCDFNGAGVPRTKVETSSKALMHDLVLLLAQDGIGGSAYTKKQKEGRTIRGKALPAGTLFGVQWNPAGCHPTEKTLNGRAIQSCTHRWKADEDGVWYPVKATMRTAFSGPVFNMTTESHTYITHGFLVHNCDLSLNDDLTQAGCVTFEADGMLPKFIGEPDGKTPHHYYRVLMAKQQAARKARQQQSASGPGGSAQDGDGQDGSQGQGADGPGSAGGGQPPQHQDGQPFRGCGSGSGGVAAPCELDESDDFGGLTPAISPLEKEYVHLATAASVQAYQKSRGTVPGGTIERALQVMKPTRTPWQAVLGAHLRRAVTNRRGAGSVTPSKRNRRKHAAVINDARGNRIGKVVHPATVRPAPRVEVIRDTSGSMSASDLMVVGNEIETIARRMGIRGKSLMVTDVDAATHGSVAYTGASSIAGVKGRGGTDMRVGIAEACARPPRERASTIVVITDGYTPWPATPPGVPVVAAIVVGGTVGPDTGTRLLADLPPFVRGVVCDNGLGSP